MTTETEVMDAEAQAQLIAKVGGALLVEADRLGQKLSVVHAGRYAQAAIAALSPQGQEAS